MAIKVFFNNSCSICRFEINHYKKISSNNFEWVDITNNKDALTLTSKSQKELLRRMHVIDNGEVVGGAKAFLIILTLMIDVGNKGSSKINIASNGSPSPLHTS